MRLTRLIPAAFMLCVSGPAFTQGWIEYSSRADRFSINFPGQPKIEEIKYRSEIEATFPARVYTAAEGRNRYSITVVDYTDAQKIHAERAKNCPPDAHTGCSGSPTMGVGAWIVDVDGAIDFATWKFIQRDAKITYFAWHFIDLIQGRQLQLTNADKSRTFVGIYMHENRLYILEATVPAGAPDPGLFQQSLGFLDQDGKGVRYESVYYNSFPPPRRTR